MFLNSTACRACLSKPGDNATTCLIKECQALDGDPQRFELLTKLFQSISISIHGEDYIICESCDSHLQSVIKFFEMCKRSEESLIQKTVKIDKAEEICVTPDINTVKLEISHDEISESIAKISSIRERRTMFGCEKCSKRFSSVERLSSHILQFHPIVKVEITENVVICNECNEEFKDKKQLRKHMGSHAGMRFLCECGKTFASKKARSRHKMIRCSLTVNQPLEFPCPEPNCRKSFAQEKYLEYHLNVHRGIKPHLCSYCGRAYHNPNSVITHEDRVHKNEPKKTVHKKTPRLCDTCGSSFGRKYHLDRHIQNVHLGKFLARKEKCPHCEKAFIDKSCLNSHLKIHQPKKLQCPECDKMFLTKTHLKSHVDRVHLELRPFPCTVCEKTFKKKASLGKHLRTHTGEKPHQCPHCSYKCAEKSNLKKHCRIHSK